MGDAQFMADVLKNQTPVLSNPNLAQEFIVRMNPQPDSRAMLLDTSGHLLASTDPNDATRLGQVIQKPGLDEALGGVATSRIDYSPLMHSEAVDVFTPILTTSNTLVGVVRMTYQLAGIYHQFVIFRIITAGILGVGLVLGILMGLILALNINRPIQRTTQLINNLAQGDLSKQLEEQGPEEIQQLLHSVNHLAARLHEQEQNRKKLLSNLVHELGRPLGALRTGISALIKGAGKDPQVLDEYLQGMDDETLRLQRLLEDLAHLQEQILGTLELKRQPIHVDDWLPRVLQTWKVNAQQKNLGWSLKIPENLPAIYADPDRLAQAVGNLISNAIKFTPGGGSITVSAGVKGKNIWIRIRDTGPGIPPEDMERIFEPFYRGHQAGRIPQGMGLGLGITRDLVTAHGGKLQVESKVGEGSDFTIWLPI
jgi:signal transduction histidine kinase